MADPIRLEFLQHGGDLFDRARLAAVDGNPEAELAGTGEEVAVVGRPEVGRLRAGDVDTDDASVAPGDRFLDDDFVQPKREVAVQAEDQAGLDRVLEHGPVHTAQRRSDDVVQVLLAAAVAFHGVEAQLHGGDVVLAVGAADDFVDGPLDSQRRRLDQLGPVEKLQVLVEGVTAPCRGRDHLAELPVVLRRQLDALLVGDAPHDGGRDGPTEVAVKLGERHPARQLADHCPENSHFARKCLRAGRARARRRPDPPDPTSATTAQPSMSRKACTPSHLPLRSDYRYQGARRGWDGGPRWSSRRPGGNQ